MLTSVLMNWVICGIVVLSLVSALVGCGGADSSESDQGGDDDNKAEPLVTHGMSVVIENKDTEDIYAVALTPGAEADVGVVGAGAKATMGFFPFAVGGDVQVKWGYTLERKHIHTLSTVGWEDAASKASDAAFVYMGNGQWVFELRDFEAQTVLQRAKMIESKHGLD